MSNGTPISNHPVLRAHADKLQRLGYTTVEEVAGASLAAHSDLVRYLNEDVHSKLPPVPAPQRRTFPLGVALHRIPKLKSAFAMPSSGTPPAVLPAMVNLMNQMPGILDQGERGTCVAFATLATLENLRTSQGRYKSMSEQFLYWDCKQNDGDPNGEGTYVAIAMQLLQRDGCCLSAAWPYNPQIMQNNEGQGPPPAGAVVEAKEYRIVTMNHLPQNSVSDLKAELARGRCIAFSIPVFNSWYQNSTVQDSGDIVMPFPGEPVATDANGNPLGHAMCLGGYQDDARLSAIGGGRFILRNSWNSDWGTHSPYGIGNGTIPYDYLTKFCSEAYSVE